MRKWHDQRMKSAGIKLRMPRVYIETDCKGL